MRLILLCLAVALAVCVVSASEDLGKPKISSKSLHSLQKRALKKEEKHWDQVKKVAVVYAVDHAFDSAKIKPSKSQRRLALKAMKNSLEEAAEATAEGTVTFKGASKTIQKFAHEAVTMVAPQVRPEKEEGCSVDSAVANKEMEQELRQKQKKMSLRKKLMAVINDVLYEASQEAGVSLVKKAKRQAQKLMVKVAGKIGKQLGVGKEHLVDPKLNGKQRARAEKKLKAAAKQIVALIKSKLQK
eukprot:GILI01002889.1.p1 GENE.GILI01002889.1~~GILI01002889.1.p1  ORF type:complete len:243 (-),score=115.57 GILI01002889.1:344-1072(-)